MILLTGCSLSTSDNQSNTEAAEATKATVAPVTKVHLNLSECMDLPDYTEGAKVKIADESVVSVSEKGTLRGEAFGTTKVHVTVDGQKQTY